jgi:hypothetical protein
MSNGRLLPTSVDLRSATARRFKHLMQSYTLEFGGSALSEADRALIRQAVSLQLRAEALQTAIVRGDDVDNDELVRLNSESRRALAAIRAKGDANKPPAPTIHDVLALEDEEA